MGDLTLGRLGIIWVIGLYATGPTSPDRPETNFVSSRIEDRVVKRFDFDERKLGNFELTPMNWRQLSGPGFPRFLEPRLDGDVGHEAPPSFRLALQGGSLACRYLAKDIPVHPDSDYRISVWVRTSKVVHSEAYISACFLDHALQRIDASSVRSEPVRDASDEGKWWEVSVLLPGGYPKARWIGLSCQLEQPIEGLHYQDDPRPIEARDPLAEAWFDDLTVTRLPRVSLRMEAPGSVFAAHEPVTCFVRVADVDGRGLSASLEVRDADGKSYGNQTIPITGQSGEACSAELGPLPPGRFMTRLSVRSEGHEIASCERTFVRLGPDLRMHRSRRGGWGLILDATESGDQRAVERLVRLLAPDAVKIPLWRADMNDEAVVLADRRVHGLMRALEERSTSIVGVLAAPPAGLSEQLGHRGISVVDVLCAPVHQWAPYLGFLFSRYGDRVNAWQIGSDDTNATAESERISRATGQLREALRPLSGAFQIAVPQNAVVRTFSGPTTADVDSFFVGAEIGADQLNDQLKPSSDARQARRWATLEPLDPARYSLRVRLREETRRRVLALHAGMETVFVRQPWTFDGVAGDPSVAPSEDFMLFRTLQQTLGGLSPMGRVWLDDGVSAWLFGDAKPDDGAMVIWTDGDEDSPRRIVTDTAPAAQLVDIQGRRAEICAVDGGMEFSIDSMPVVLAPVAPSRVRTLASFAVLPTIVAPTVQEQRLQISLRNHGTKRMVGSMRWNIPVSWQITPQMVPMDLAAGQETQMAVSLRLPSNQAAGTYTLIGRFTGTGEGQSPMTFRTPIVVGSPELDVNVLTCVEGRGLRIVQRVTNRSNRTLNLRGLLIAPPVARQVSTIRQLVAGQTAVRTYHVEDAAALTDRWIRVSVEQVDGPIRHNDVVKIE